MDIKNQVLSASLNQDNNLYQMDNNFDNKVDVNSSSSKTNSTPSNLQDRIEKEFSSDDDWWDYEKDIRFTKTLTDENEKQIFRTKRFNECLRILLKRMGADDAKSKNRKN